MADTAARTMRLLTLLQRRRYWPGPELARRLEVSPRTLRRDVERLRSLGYAVAADRGVAGGYQLESADAVAPLLVDNDEAVALAVGLQLAAQGAPELAEAAIGALSKVLPLLPADRRRRARSVSEATALGPGALPAPGPPLDVLAIAASACRDGVRLSFHYQRVDGVGSERYVEPCGLVALGARYYLVAFDGERDDWRTFRLDRISDVRAARTPFTRRPPPADDLQGWVRDAHRRLRSRYRVVVVLHCSADLLADYRRWVDVEAIDDGGCRVAMDTDDFSWPLQLVATVGVEFDIVEPVEFADYVGAAARRFAGAAGGRRPRSTMPGR